MASCYKNAITNELFFSLGAQLAALHEARCRAALAPRGTARMRRAAASSVAARSCVAAKTYHQWASRELMWFLASGMLNASSLVNDGLDTFAEHPALCINNRRTAYTYNQGVLLSGLGALYASAQPAPRAPDDRRRRTAVGAADARGDDASAADTVDAVASAAARDVDAADAPSSGASWDDRAALLRLAASVVEAVWASSLVYAGSGGVLREEGEAQLSAGGTLRDLYHGAPGTDGLQFKSVLLRHLRYLIDDVARAHRGDEAAAQHAVAQAGANLSEWRRRVAANGASIWRHAACVASVPLSPGANVTVPALFGYLWRGPCSWAFGGASATTQTAALDVFTAAAF